MKQLFLMGIAFLVLATGSEQGRAAMPDVRELLNRYTQALDSTCSFIDGYEKHTDFSYRLNGMKDKGKGIEQGQLRYDDGHLYSRTYRWGDFSIKHKNLPQNKSYYQCHLTTDKITYQQDKWMGCDKPGSVHRYPRRNNIPVSLGRHFGVSFIAGYINSDERLDVILRRAKRLRVHPETEEVGGSACFVMDADTKYGKYRIWLDPEHGYHPAQVFNSAAEGDYSHGHPCLRGDTSKTYLRNVHFEKVEGIWVPVEADSGSDRRTSTGNFVKEDYHYKRNHIILKPDHDTLGSFDDPLVNPANDPELVDGTRIQIDGSQEEYVWRDGKAVKKGQEKENEK